MQNGPYFVIPSRKGAVPSLTPTQARAILTKDERILSLSVFDAIDYAGPCSKLQVSYAAFCGLPDYSVILTLRTPFLGVHASAPSTDSGIAGDHERGRSAISLVKWAETLRAVKPAAAVQLSESIPLSEPASKRRRVATTRTTMWSNKTEEMRKGLQPCELMKPMAVVGSEGGGFLDMFARNENARELSEGLTGMRLSVGTPSLLCASSIVDMLAAVAAGVQLVESTLPWALAEKGIALTFTIPHVAVEQNPGIGGEVEIDLNDDAYTLDIEPLCRGCRCYTCTRHNRAYIHHLLSVQEMNSNILLCIHNLHHVVQVFRRARALQGDRVGLEDFLVRLVSQF